MNIKITSNRNDRGQLESISIMEGQDHILIHNNDEIERVIDRLIKLTGYKGKQ